MNIPDSIQKLIDIISNKIPIKESFFPYYNVTDFEMPEHYRTHIFWIKNVNEVRLLITKKYMDKEICATFKKKFEDIYFTKLEIICKFHNQNLERNYDAECLVCENINVFSDKCHTSNPIYKSLIITDTTEFNIGGINDLFFSEIDMYKIFGSLFKNNMNKIKSANSVI